MRRTAGSLTYPVGYGYDAQGRMTSLTNWSSFAAQTGARVTTWQYNERGLLADITYAGSSGPSFTYTKAGRLHIRTWARGVRTTNTYNASGDLSGVTYSDGTPSLTLSYDNRGRPTNFVHRGITTALTYNGVEQVLSESQLGLYTLYHTYDYYLRPATLGANPTLGSLCTYTYDGVNRLSSVSDGVTSATYTYLANSALVEQITLARGLIGNCFLMLRRVKLNRGNMENRPFNDTDLNGRCALQYSGFRIEIFVRMHRLSQIHRPAKLG